MLGKRYGENGFDYAGNDTSDLAVFKHARTAIVVNAMPRLQMRAKALGNAEIFQTDTTKSGGLKSWLKLLRLHQWKKNILLLAAPVAGHLIFDFHLWLPLFLAFFAFSLTASCV